MSSSSAPNQVCRCSGQGTRVSVFAPLSRDLAAAHRASFVLLVTRVSKASWTREVQARVRDDESASFELVALSTRVRYEPVRAVEAETSELSRGKEGPATSVEVSICSGSVLKDPASVFDPRINAFACSIRHLTLAGFPCAESPSETSTEKRMKCNTVTTIKKERR
jgi:hypothetical protein